MEYVDLGATGLRVSVAGLGCGGASRLGLGQGKSLDDAIRLVHEAIALGVNIFDTAEAYGTEDVLGAALADTPREAFVLSSKTRIAHPDGRLFSGAEVVANLDASLRRLRVEQIDVFHLHAVLPAQYYHVMREIAPALWRAKEDGKIGCIGISEHPDRDPDQAMLCRALFDDCWGVIMPAFNMLNQGTRELILPRAKEKRMGVMVMYAMRGLFSDQVALQRTIQKLAADGQVSPELAEVENPLGFLLHELGAQSLTEAAYRYSRHEPGVDVVLFGTGDPGHLRANIEAINKPPLPATDRDRLAELFGGSRATQASVDIAR